MGRYVILRHDLPPGDTPGVHWDLMLEADGGLRTWALAELPATDRPIAAEQLPDHRIMYLDYEGPISDDRGSVTRWDRGQFETVRETPLELAVSLAGDRLRGQAMLTRRSDDSRTWQFKFTERTDVQSSL
jgi:DNA polymerase ligase (LigD)-like protein